MSRLLALLISSSSACEKPPLLQLFDSTRTLAPVAAAAWITNSIALIESASVPLPVASRNLDAMMLVVQLTPTTPVPLLPSAPMVPATCVPWPLSSKTSSMPQDFVIALKPCVPTGQLIVWPAMTTENGAGADQLFAARSGCV